MKPLLLLITTLCLTCTYAEETKTTQVEILNQSTQMWNGTTLPAYPTETPEITIIKVTIPAGEKLVWHKHPSINAGYLIKGALTVESATGETLEMKAGDTLIELVDQWHRGFNPGKEPAEIIVFYAGSTGVPLAIKKELH